LALENKLHPPDSFMNDVMEFLNEVIKQNSIFNRKTDYSTGIEA
jgi:hypothetical protein